MSKVLQRFKYSNKPKDLRISILEIRGNHWSESTEILRLEDDIENTDLTETEKEDFLAMLSDIKKKWFKVEKEIDEIDWDDPEDAPTFSPDDPIVQHHREVRDAMGPLIWSLVRKKNKNTAFRHIMEDLLDMTEEEWSTLKPGQIVKG